METTAFDTTAILNPKGGLAQCVKAPGTPSPYAVHTDTNALFAGILDEQLALATLADSASAPKTAAGGEKRFWTAAQKRSPFHAKPTPTGDGEGPKVAHPLSATSKKESCSEIAGDPALEILPSASAAKGENSTSGEAPLPSPFQSEAASAMADGLHTPFAPRSGKKTPSLAEPEEPTPGAKAVSSLAAERSGRPATMPAGSTDRSNADPTPAGISVPQLETPCEPSGSLFAAATMPQGRVHLGTVADPSSTGDALLTKTAPPAPKGMRPLSDRFADHRAPAGSAERHPFQPEAERGGESSLAKRTEYALKPQSGEPLADAGPDRAPVAAPEPVGTADPQENRPLADRPLDHYAPVDNAESSARSSRLTERHTPVGNAERRPFQPKAESPANQTGYTPNWESGGAMADARQEKGPVPASEPAGTVDPQESRPLADRPVGGAEQHPFQLRAQRGGESSPAKQTEYALQKEGDEPTAEARPDKGSVTVSEPAGTVDPQESRPLADRLADHRAPAGAAERRALSSRPTERSTPVGGAEQRPFQPRAERGEGSSPAKPAEYTLMSENSGPVAEARSDKKRAAAVTPSGITDPQEDFTLPGRPTEPHPPARIAERRTAPEKNERRSASSSVPHQDAPQKTENGGAEKTVNRPVPRQEGPSHHDTLKKGDSRDAAWVAAAPKDPVATAGRGDSAIDLSSANLRAAGESEPKGLHNLNLFTGTQGPINASQPGKNSVPKHLARSAEHDISAFSIEMPRIAPVEPSLSSSAAGAARVEMQAVIDQILEVRQAVSNDSGRIRILLSPPDLGTVDLDIVVRGERVDVIMTAENTTVQQALQSQGEEIRTALQRQDLKIEGFQVLLQDNGASQPQTGSGGMYRQNREPQEHLKTNGNPPPAFTPFSSIAGARRTEGLLSVFA